MVTRIAKLKGYDNVVVGKCLDGVLEDGHVYSVRKVCGEIIITDLGEHFMKDGFGGVSLTVLLKDGSHLYTKEEGLKLGL